MTAITVFASASQAVDFKFNKVAREVGKLSAQNGLTVICGGVREGSMCRCISGSLRNGGRAIGVILQSSELPITTEPGLQLIFVANPQERKRTMIELGDIILVLPGGFGTLDELTEVLALKTFGVCSKPVIILNSYGYYDYLLQFLATITNLKFSDMFPEKLYEVVETPQEFITLLGSRL